MEIRYGFPFQGAALEKLRSFLHDQGLEYDDQVQCSVCAMEGSRIAASGSLDGAVLKDIAVDPAYRREGLAALVVTELINQAAQKGQYHLFVFTKPEHRDLFSSLGFYPIAQTPEALLLENRKEGIARFVAGLQKLPGTCIAAIVANCNPFTKGHLYLIETAARQCDGVHLFILSENKSEFPANLRRELALRGTAHIPNVIVQPTGPYLISGATFPEYFLKEYPASQVNGALDLTIFAECFARPLHITRRFVGTEPYSPTTAAYNRQMQAILPNYGIEVVEVPRLEVRDQDNSETKAVSASRVRKLLRERKLSEMESLVTPDTYRYFVSVSNNPVFEGTPAVSLEEILAERETRSFRQQTLCSMYQKTLICFTLNIPGEYKVFPLARRCFKEAQHTLRLRLKAEGLKIFHEEISETPAGFTGYMLIPGKPEPIKALACDIEERHFLGRLFDLDVISPAGVKLSRSTGPRRCLICGNPAFVCGRSRAHPIEEVQKAMLTLMQEFLRERLGNLVLEAALKAILDEAAVTPKPGLVDRNNSGAHQDMDFFTFIHSAGAILPFFRDCALAGFESSASPRELFDSLRPAGKTAECLMQEATGGVNTHKGLLFSVAVISAAYGVLYRKTDTPDLAALLQQCQAMTEHLSKDFFRPQTESSPSHGEILYARYGVQGIRGEVTAGFPAVQQYSYPVLRRLLDQGQSINDAGIAAFLTLLAHVDDTNIIYRSDMSTLRRIQGETAAFLRQEPSLEALRDKAAELDRQFIAQNISPGGCADLLAVTFFLHWLLAKKR